MTHPAHLVKNDKPSQPDKRLEKVEMNLVPKVFSKGTSASFR